MRTRSLVGVFHGPVHLQMDENNRGAPMLGNHHLKFDGIWSKTHEHLDPLSPFFAVCIGGINHDAAPEWSI